MKLRVLKRSSSSAVLTSGDSTTFPASSDSLENPKMSGNPRYSGNNFFSLIKTPRASTRKAASDTKGSEISLSLVIHATGLRSTTRMSISVGNFRTTWTSSTWGSCCMRSWTRARFTLKMFSPSCRSATFKTCSRCNVPSVCSSIVFN